MSSSIADVEFLARSEHRVAALRALAERPRTRDELRDATDASKATVARLLNEFEDRDWVVREDHRYDLTDHGQFVADEFLRLVDRLESERELRDVWQWFPTDLPGFSVALFADAVVSFPDPANPYYPIPRFVELVEAASTMRGFSARCPKPNTYDAILRNAADGMGTELVFAPAVCRDMLSVADESLLRDAVDGGSLALFEHDSLPMDAGFAILDDRLSLWGRDEDGLSKAGIDTGSADALEWGASIYEDVRSDARRVDVLEQVA